MVAIHLSPRPTEQIVGQLQPYAQRRNARRELQPLPLGDELAGVGDELRALHAIADYRQHVAATAPSTPADASPPSAALRRDPSKLDGVYARLRERVGSKTLPAAALAVGDADGEIRSEAFAAKGLIRTDSLFFLASVTKPIFATAFMQLVESGAISLDAPIVRYIPEFANAPGKADVTSVHLLTHSSGVPDYPVDRIRRDRPSAAAMTQNAIDSPLKFMPGTHYEYCSASFYLLARIIEQASGQRYTDYLRSASSSRWACWPPSTRGSREGRS